MKYVRSSNQSLPSVDDSCCRVQKGSINVDDLLPSASGLRTPPAGFLAQAEDAGNEQDQQLQTDPSGPKRSDACWDCYLDDTQNAVMRPVFSLVTGASKGRNGGQTRFSDSRSRKGRVVKCEPITSTMPTLYRLNPIKLTPRSKNGRWTRESVQATDTLPVAAEGVRGELGTEK